MIELPALEYHVAHTCNLSCEQCSHYSNFHPSAPMPTPEQTVEGICPLVRIASALAASPSSVVSRRSTRYLSSTFAWLASRGRSQT